MHFLELQYIRIRRVGVGVVVRATLDLIDSPSFTTLVLQIQNSRALDSFAHPSSDSKMNALWRSDHFITT